jgi:hypothetical protein
LRKGNGRRREGGRESDAQRKGFASDVTGPSQREMARGRERERERREGNKQKEAFIWKDDSHTTMRMSCSKMSLRMSLKSYQMKS